MNQNNNGQRNGQNNLGNNRTVQNPNQGVPGGSQNGSSFLNDTPSTGTTPRRGPNGEVELLLTRHLLFKIV